jgi:hypothetical protein
MPLAFAVELISSVGIESGLDTSGPDAVMLGPLHCGKLYNTVDVGSWYRCQLFTHRNVTQNIMGIS